MEKLEHVAEVANPSEAEAVAAREAAMLPKSMHVLGITSCTLTTTLSDIVYEPGFPDEEKSKARVAAKVQAIKDKYARERAKPRK